jgi:hypothetical protein
LEHVGVPEIAEAIANFLETSVLGMLLMRIDFKPPWKGIEPPIAQPMVNRKEVGANTRAGRGAGPYSGWLRPLGPSLTIQIFYLT